MPVKAPEFLQFYEFLGVEESRRATQMRSLATQELTISRDFHDHSSASFIGASKKILVVRDLCGTRRLARKLFY